MCAFLLLLLCGPRFGIIFWWLVSPGRWESAFDSFVAPALGFIFLPWTTLMFVAVAPFGNVDGADWAWLALAFMGDLITFGVGGVNRNRVPGYA